MNFILGILLVIFNISFTTAQPDKEYITYKIINAITTSDYKTVEELYKTIDEDQPNLFNKAISQTLKHAFDKINLEKLIKYLETHENKEESVFGYLDIFDEMKSRNKLNDEALVTLAFGLKKLLSENLGHDVKDEANRLRDALPESVKNLAFANQVCIIADAFGKKEPLYAANDAFNYDSSRRRVFAWIPDERVTQGTWTIEPHGEAYLIKNVKHQEYLYAPSRWYSDSHGRKYVFTWIPEEIDDYKQLEWKFQPIENDVYINNVHFDEHLIIKDGIRWDYNRDQNRSIVFSHKVYTGSPTLWKIENCS